MTDSQSANWLPVEKRVHTLNERQFAKGSVFGWRDDSSPTGWWSGIVTGHAPCAVIVNNIRPGKPTWLK